MTHKKSLLRHIVLFKFKDEFISRNIKKIEEEFCELPKQIPEILEFEWGIDVSIENKAQGFTHCFFLTFANESDRDVYLLHPAHKAFVEILQVHLEKLLVIDYWSK